MNQDVHSTVELAIACDDSTTRHPKQVDQKESTSPKIDHSATDHEIRLRMLLQRAAGEKKISVLNDEVESNLIDRLLWKRVLQARMKLIHDCFILREGERASDQISLLDLEADIDKHCESPTLRWQEICICSLTQGT